MNKKFKVVLNSVLDVDDQQWMDFCNSCGIDDWEREYIEDDYRNVLAVFYNDKCLFYKTDYMEPEDATFVRDMSWIGKALEDMYNLGLQEGKNASN